MRPNAGAALCTFIGFLLGYHQDIYRRAFCNACSYSKERKAFGKEIYKHQAIAFKLADMATEVEAAELLTFQAAYLKLFPNDVV